MHSLVAKGSSCWHEPVESVEHDGPAPHGQLDAPEEWRRAVPLDRAYRAFASEVWRFLVRMGLDAGEVEDALHDVFLIVHRKSQNYAGRSTYKTTPAFTAAIALGISGVIALSGSGREHPALAVQAPIVQSRIEGVSSDSAPPSAKLWLLSGAMTRAVEKRISPSRSVHEPASPSVASARGARVQPTGKSLRVAPAPAVAGFPEYPATVLPSTPTPTPTRSGGAERPAGTGETHGARGRGLTDLDAELALLEAARKAYSRGRAAKACRVLSTFHQRHPRGQLRREARRLQSRCPSPRTGR